MKNYEYIEVADSLYINREISLIKLCYLLLIKTKPFQILKAETRSKIINNGPDLLIKIIRIAQLLIIFYKNKNIYNKKITVSFYGHLLLKLRLKEYKIFNLNKNEVITVFPDVYSSSMIEDRVACLKDAAKCNIAPNLIDFSVEKRFIIEDYFNLNRPNFEIDNLDVLHSKLFPLLKEIMNIANPKTIIIEQYIKELTYSFKLLIERFDDKNTIEEPVSTIEKFYEKILIQLQNQLEKELILGYTHGDLWEGNILYKDNYYRIIDWNTFAYRSLYYDYFFAMFMLGQKKRCFDKINQKKLIDFGKVLNKSIIQYENSSNNIKYKKMIGNYDSYRYVFYLELIILNVKMTELYEENEKEQLNEILIWINRFNLFEEMISTE